jgi:hypothetical protein
MKDVILTPGDLDIGWRTVWMEARGEPYEGKVAVASWLTASVTRRVIS